MSTRTTSTAGPNPFVGPRPFEAGEKLYGREREIAELGDRLGSERIILLHSPSGAGKSSLVQAGLLPGLRRAFDVWGPTRVNQPPLDGENGNRSVANRYAMSAVQGFEEGIPERGRRAADVLTRQTLAEYFAHRPRRRRAPPNVLLVFDQFEEVLTVDPLHVEAKEGFFDQLGELLRVPRVFALFILREDYLAPLDPYARRVPTHLRNRFRIDLLGLDGARQAMVEPARSGGREFPAVDRMVHDLATRKVQQVDGSFEEQTGRHVEPVQLQVACRRLWDAMPKDDLSIDPEDLERFGDVTEALGGYYADSVAAVTGDDARAERAVREWFDHRLITAGGIRGQVLREAGESGGLANELIEGLRGTHLIRAEERAGATWYELAHDRLVDPVKKNNADWSDQNLSAVQQRASLWERQERSPGLLMKDEELAAGERWATDNKAGPTEGERRFLAASREAQDAVERERRQARWIRVLAVAALIVAVLAGWQWWEASKAQAAAEAEKKKALDLARTATVTSLLANEENELANLVALEIRQPDDTPTTVAILHDALAVYVSTRVVLKGHSSYISEAVFAPDGRRILTASSDMTARIWDAAPGRAETGQEIHILSGHSDEVHEAAWSPDGRRILTASDDHTARIWDAETGQEVHTLSGHSNKVYKAAWSPDGRRILTASWDKTVRIWDAETGQEVHTLSGHYVRRYKAAWSPDGRRVLTASGDTTARIWDAETGDEILTLSGHSKTVDRAAWSPDGRRVLTASEDTTARIWDAETGQETHTLSGHSARVYKTVWSPDGRRVLTASSDMTARIWDAETGQGIRILRTDFNWFSAALWSPDGRRVFTASDNASHDFPLDGTAHIWDAATGRRIHTLSRDFYSSVVVAGLWSPDGRHILIGSDDDTARIWDAATGQVTHTLSGHSDFIRAKAWSPDGRRVLTASAETAYIWNAFLGEEIHTLSGQVVAAAWSPDGRRVLTTSWYKRARIWDAETGQETHTLSRRSTRIRAAAWSLDGRRVLTVSGDKTARIWNAETGQETHTLSGHSKVVDAAAWSPDGRRVLTASKDKTARIWNAETGQETHTLSGHSKAVDAAAWSPDGRRVLTASKDKTARIWNAETGQETHTLSGHSNAVVAAAWSPDGRRVLTASRDKTARIWNAETGQETHTLSGHSNAVDAAAWSPDGRRVLTASKDATARIWNAETGDEIHTLSGHSKTGFPAAWSPDGRRVLTASDEKAHIWDAETGQKIHIISGHASDVFVASWSPDGRRVFTASDDETARIWAAGDMEHFQGRIRARTARCLDAEFRRNVLGEDAAVADAHAAACEACVPGFFDRMKGVPRGAVEPYAEAFREYRACLDRETENQEGAPQ